MEPRKVRSRSEDDMDDRVSQADIILAHQEYKMDMEVRLAELKEYGERLNRTGWTEAWGDYAERLRCRSRAAEVQRTDSIREYVSDACGPGPPSSNIGLLP